MSAIRFRVATWRIECALLSQYRIAKISRWPSLPWIDCMLPRKLFRMLLLAAASLLLSGCDAAPPAVQAPAGPPAPPPPPGAPTSPAVQEPQKQAASKGDASAGTGKADSFDQQKADRRFGNSTAFYAEFVKRHKRAPRSWEELVSVWPEFTELADYIVHFRRSGYIIVWGSPYVREDYLQAGDDPAQYILVYPADAAERGGKVITANYKVRYVTANQFRDTPLAGTPPQARPAPLPPVGFDTELEAERVAKGLPPLKKGQKKQTLESVCRDLGSLDQFTRTHALGQLNTYKDKAPNAEVSKALTRLLQEAQPGPEELPILVQLSRWGTRDALVAIQNVLDRPGLSGSKPLAEQARTAIEKREK
jgi:hypothetical protein